MTKKRVVIVGAGFGGVAAAKSLAGADCEVHIVDRRNFHLFQPLLYQVAMAGLNPSDIAIPLRRLFVNQKNIYITLAEVDKLDVDTKRIHFDERWLDYDYLILGCGAKHFYFGQNGWEDVAPGLKTLEQATEIRRRILTAFELAEKEQDPVARESLLTFVIIGGGPTGVELAGAIAEMAIHSLYKDYKIADLKKTKVMLVEAGPRVLAAFPPQLSAITEKNLEKLGVTVVKNTRATDLAHDGLKLGEHFISTHTIIWAAGVKPSSLTQQIPGDKDPSGRIFVNTDLSLPGHDHVFVIGDQAAFKDDKGVVLPGLAPVAVQEGHFVGNLISRELKGKPRTPFKYLNKGIMATIGRSKAVVSVGGINIHGFIAWLVWVFIHIVYLMKFQNRFFVFLHWAWSYFRFGRSARLILHKTWRFYSGEKISIK